MTKTTRSHLRQSFVLLALLFLPTLAFATTPSTLPVCTSPLDGGHCVKTFSIVSISYIVIGFPYIALALLILKPRFERTMPWALAMAFGPLFSFIFAMLGFTIGGAAGLLRYPHDVSPFFYIDWFVVVLMLILQTVYIVLIHKKWGGAPTSPHAATA